MEASELGHRSFATRRGLFGRPVNRWHWLKYVCAWRSSSVSDLSFLARGGGGEGRRERDDDEKSWGRWRTVREGREGQRGKRGARDGELWMNPNC